MNEPHNQAPMNDNDELAKALNGGLQFEETPMSGPAADGTMPDPTDTPVPSDPQLPPPPPNDDLPQLPPIPPLPAKEEDNDKPKDDDKDPPSIHEAHATKSHGKSGASSDLDKIKTAALEELRPLIGKLDLSPDDKFDTYLLIIRSTDDQSLLEEAHEAAKAITDETKRAQALLDIVKEADYFAGKK